MQIDHSLARRVCESLLDTRLVRRLSNIKQLGSVFFVVPKAVHNRLHHSIQVAVNVATVLNRIRGQYGPSAIKDQDFAALCAYALLHDLGHLPLSHEMEEFFDLDHENILGILLTEPEIKAVLGRYGIFQALSKIKFTINQDSLAKDLMNSAVDCDRLAYLDQDSTVCEIRNCHAIASTTSRILDELRPVRFKGQLRLALPVKCKKDAEGLLLFRQQLHEEIYSSPLALAVKELVRATLRDQPAALEGYPALNGLMQRSPHKFVSSFAQAIDSTVVDFIANTKFSQPLDNLVHAMLAGDLAKYVDFRDRLNVIRSDSDIAKGSLHDAEHTISTEILTTEKTISSVFDAHQKGFGRFLFLSDDVSDIVREVDLGAELMGGGARVVHRSVFVHHT